MMCQRVFLISVLLLTAGCGQQITDFVTSGEKRPVFSDLPSSSLGVQTGVKLSPGANLSKGTNVKSRFSITPFQRSVQGTQIKSRFTLHQSRPE